MTTDKPIVPDPSNSPTDAGATGAAPAAEVAPGAAPAAAPAPADGEASGLSDAERLAAAEQAARDNYDRFLRAAAELENYRKRAAREMSELRKYANQTLVRDLLPIVDNLERAIDAARAGHGEDHSLLEGVDMIRRELLKVLEGNGVTPVEALGRPFDPNLHEAVMQEEAPADVADQTVLRELQKGYCIHDRLVRPAMVVVARKSA